MQSSTEALPGLAALAVAALLASGCATTPPPLTEAPACDAATFVPAAVAQAACRREVCRDGKVELIEDLAGVAPVDDWAEERFCARHPFSCLRAYGLKDKTNAWVKGLAGRYWSKKDIRYGLGDAARHAHLMCVLAERFGAEFARGLGVAHESDSGYLLFARMGAPSNHCCERDMDLFNNEVGISLAGQPGSCEDKVLASLDRLRHSGCPRGTDDYPDE